MPIGELVPAIVRFRGDTAPDKFILVDEDGAAVDISAGYSFLFTLNRSENPTDETDQLYQLTGAVTDGPAGFYEFRPTASNTNLAPGFYWYDVQVTDPTGYIKTVEKEPMEVTQDITKT